MPNSDQQLTLNSTVVVSSNQLSAHLSDEVVVLNLQSGSYFGLDNVAAHIWSLIQQPITCSDVAAALLEEYEVEKSQIEADVMHFIQNLHELELLDVQP